jgi:hypothetical protein
MVPIIRHWFEDNVYTSHYNSDIDRPEIVCPNCNRINRSMKKWTYESLEPRKNDLNELSLFQLIGKFHTNGGNFAKYYDRYGASVYGGKDEWYENKSRYEGSEYDRDNRKKVQVSFK